MVHASPRMVNREVKWAQTQSRFCTPWRCKSTPTRKANLLCGLWINIGNVGGFGNSPKIRRPVEPVPLSRVRRTGPLYYSLRIFGLLPWPLTFKPKINRLRQAVDDYCAKFQVIPIRDFRFIMLTHAQTPTYPHTHAHIHCDKVIAISAPPYYVVGADYGNNKHIFINSSNI